jgi:hypothetical protein
MKKNSYFFENFFGYSRVIGKKYYFCSEIM